MQKVVMEFPLSSNSTQTVWDYISTPAGLASWFADEVSQKQRFFTFKWGKNEIRTAELTNSRQITYVRFHWADEEPGSYFEMRLSKNEMTGLVMLQITECASSVDEDEVQSLWQSSVDALKRTGA